MSEQVSSPFTGYNTVTPPKVLIGNYQEERALLAERAALRPTAAVKARYERARAQAG